MADDRLNFILTARDNASATITRLKGELGALGGAGAQATGPLGRLWSVTGGLITPTTLAIGAAAGLGAAALGAARAAMDEERGIASLTAALQANDPAAARNIDQIEETIRQRENLAFSDDVQRTALARLTAQTGDATKALELSRTAMDLARLRNIDLTTAAVIMGKVYGGNIGILSRYGIQLAKGTTATEAIAEIQERAAGQAKEYANTTAGAWESLGLVWDDLSEDIGRALLPVLRDLAITLRDDIIPALRDLGDVLPFDTIAQGAENLGKSFRDFVGDFIYLTLNFGESGNIIHEQAEQFGLTFDDLKRRIRDRMMETGETFTEAKNHIVGTLKAQKDEATSAQWEMMQGIYSASVQGRDMLAPISEEIGGQQAASIKAHWQETRDAAFQQQVEYAKGLMDAQNEPKVALAAMAQINREALTKQEEIAFLGGQNTITQLRNGMNSQKPEVRAAAQAAYLAVADRLGQLGAQGRLWGLNLVTSYAEGIDNGVGYVRDAAGRIAVAAEGQIGIRSEPKDPTSALRGITQWGGNLAETFAEGIEGGAGMVRRAFQSFLPPGMEGGPTATIPSPGTYGPYGAMGAGYGGVVINFYSTIPPSPSQASALARQLVPELVREMARQGKN